MNTRPRIVALSFTLLIIAVSQISISFASSLTITKTIGSSATIVYPRAWSNHLVVYSFTITDGLASFIASRFNLVDVDFGATIGFEKIKAANPNIKIVGYRDFMYMSTWYSGWNIVNENEGWFLHTKYGNTTEYRVRDHWGDAYVMDVSSSGWRNYFANWAGAKLAAFPMVDGIFADDVAEAISFSPGWTNPFNVPLTDIPGDIIKNWNTYMIGMIQTVKSALGSHLLIINTPDLNGLFIQYCDGQMIEHFLHRTSRYANDFKQTNPTAEMQILQKLSATGKIIMAFSANTPNPNISLEDDIVQTNKCMLYCLCGFLLAYSGKAGFGFHALHSDFTGHECYWDEMDAPIGTPTGARYNVQGGLWARNFTAGRVLLNIEDLNTYTVNLEGTNYSVAPRSGLIVPT